MLSTSSTKLKLLIVACLFAFIGPATAQDRYQHLNFKIDSLANVGLPKSALKEVDKLDSIAHRDNNSSQQIRAVIYRMTFQSYLEENALTAIISRLKADIDQSKYPVKPVLQSLLAEMYWKYYQQNRYQFNQRSRLQTPDSDFTRWDLQTIVTEVSRLYQLSLADALKEQGTPIGILKGVLQGDEHTRYLRPTLYDLLVQRAFEFYLTDEPELVKPRLPFRLDNAALFGNGKTFAVLRLDTKDTTSNYYLGIRYLQQATLFHLRDDSSEAVADIDLQRLRFLFGKATVAHKDSLYLSALNTIAVDFAAKPISTEAIFLQGQFYRTIDSLVTAYAFFTKAITAYPESMGGKNAAAMMKQITDKSLSATVEDINIPGKPLLALLKYKNINYVKVAIYRLSAAQATKYKGDLIKNYYTYDQNERLARQFEFLKKLTPIKTNEVNWADVSDYREHSAEIMIDALLPGNYVLLVRDGKAEDASLNGITDFTVSRLALTARTNPDGATEIRVMDRESGKPMANVHVKLSAQYADYYPNISTTKQWINIDEKGLTDKAGLFIYNKQKINNGTISLNIKGDTLVDNSKSIGGAIYVPGDADDAEDKTVLFTDRQIYRPGQTIYFKALQLKTVNNQSKIVAGKEVTVKFSDVNGEEVSSLKLKTNEYGTISGNFIIPQSMLNGDVELETDDGSINVKVEEYKRPTFQAEFLPVKESYKLNDSVMVKGTVTAFSGYGLSQAKVAYHIVRSQNIIYTDFEGVDNYIQGTALYGSRYGLRYNIPQPAEIKTDTIITDDQGGFTINFKAIPGDDPKAVTNNYTYAISADITDATGETHSAQSSVTVGNNNLVIAAYLPAMLFARDSVSTIIRLNNLNGQAQSGNITIKIDALQQPDRLFINRLWPKPDSYVLNDAEFKNDFPYYANKNEDMFAKWPVAKHISSMQMKVGDDKSGIFNLEMLKKENSGVYRVTFKAENAKGDTAWVTRYVSFIADPAKPSGINNWVIPALNAVKPGESAEFLVGIDEPVNVLMERYNGPKLISSQWLTIDKEQQRIKVPISSGDKDPAVQFMMIYQNRIYSSYQKITRLNDDDQLKIKLLTFRNKLQPGQKEQWKLQVTNLNNEKRTAEMLAGLYDASLDDITPAQNWQQALNLDNGYNPNYFVWNSYDFVNASATSAINKNYLTHALLTRDYEKLNMFNYDYYGGYNGNYNNYLSMLKVNSANAESDKRLEATYLKNAALIKDGYNITGRVIDANDGSALPGVIVKINGLSVNTTTNSNGYFKIKVPVKGSLIFSFIGYDTKTITTTKAANITVKLEGKASALNEVVVTGYGSAKRKDVTGSVVQRVMIRGLGNNAQYAVAEPNQIYTSPELDKLKGFQGAVYGLNMREIQTAVPKPITIRKNFNETAFFYPQLHTDDKGQILIEFTIPEALTKWKFRALAQTKELHTGYIENEVVTQKQLSISANMPRFLREGDTLTFSARLANLTAGQLTGKVELQLFNGINMQPVSLLQNPADAIQNFEVAAVSNKAISFKVIIPQGLDALTYRLTADAGQYSDGEENTIPVLPNRMLVTESILMMVRAGQTRQFNFDKLLNNKSTTLVNKALTLEYTQNPAWYALQALPYMMEFPYECSEQLFSRYYANSLATNLINNMPVIKQVFDRWKSSNSTELLSNLEKNQELKTTLLEETPWLRDAAGESEQKKRIALLFDLNKMSSEMQLNLEKLQQKQLPDGGFPWFGGDESDRYITQQVLGGIGQLYHLNIANDKNEKLKTIKDGALKFLDEKLITDESKARKVKEHEARPVDAIEAHAWYVRSYFPSVPMSKVLKSALGDYLKRAEKQWVTLSIYEQGMVALTMHRYGKPVVTTAIIKSLLETAQQSDDEGMYWAKNKVGYYWYQSPIETQSQMIELFTEVSKNNREVEEMKIWLLRNKQTNNWETTKATAAACYALLCKQSDWLSTGTSTEISLNGVSLNQLKPDLRSEAGTGYLKTSWADEQVKADYGKVELKNTGKTVSWGAMYWQYLEKLDKITPSNTDIHLERKYFIQKQTDAGPVAVPVDAAHQLKTGDLLKVIVYLKAGRDFEYVQLKDLRPSGTEPVNALSEYKYQDGLAYYQVTKDVATNFFISTLSKGNYVFEYQLRVAQPGNFSTGITTVKCMYAPEFNAHSEGMRMTIKP